MKNHSFTKRILTLSSAALMATSVGALADPAAVEDTGVPGASVAQPMGISGRLGQLGFMSGRTGQPGMAPGDHPGRADSGMGRDNGVAEQGRDGRGLGQGMGEGMGGGQGAGSGQGGGMGG